VAGSGSSSFALNSFSAKDPLAVISLLAFGTSVLARCVSLCKFNGMHVYLIFKNSFNMNFIVA